MTGTVPPPKIENLEFHEVLGAGGFATVYRARQIREDREVAVKVLQTAVDDARRSAFEAESRTMALVARHPRVATIFLSGLARDGRPYLVMELYRRGHYGTRAKRPPPLGEHEALSVGVQIACAVHTAHQAGIVHRDIKPENILLDAYGPVLADFGISTFRTQVALSLESAVTVPYAARELLLGVAPASAVTDVYALCATLWSLLCGRPPYARSDTDDATEQMRRIATEPVPRFPRHDVSPAFIALLRRGLDPDPAYRPTSAKALAFALQEVELELGYTPTRLEFDDGDAPEPVQPLEAPRAGRTATAVNPLLSPMPRERPQMLDGLASVSPELRPAAAAVLDGPYVQVDGYAAGNRPKPPAGVGPEAVVPEATKPGSATRRLGLLGGGVAVVVLVGVVAAVGRTALTGRADARRPPATTAATLDPTDPEAIPEIAQVAATRPAPNLVELTWFVPEVVPGAMVNVRRVDQGHADPQPRTASAAPFRVAVEPGLQACFDVWIASPSRRSDDHHVCA